MHLGKGSILLKDIAVIDGLGGKPYPHHDVLITNGIIIDIAPTGNGAAAPESTKVIKGKGMTVLPGMIDMHVHLWATQEGPSPDADPDTKQKDLNAFLYAGVTSVHDMDNDTNYIANLRDDIAAGKLLGPNISAVGTAFHNTINKDAFDMISPEVQKDISDRLDVLEARGISTIKIYAGVSNLGARHISALAKPRGFTVFADMWCNNLTLGGFRVTNVDSWAHGGCWEIEPYVAEWMKDNGKYAMMTLSIFTNMSGERPYADYETKGFYKNPLIRDVMGKKRLDEYYANFHKMRASTYEGENAFYHKQHFGDMTGMLDINLANTKTLYDAGVVMGMGTDTPAPAVTWAGESMHNELAMHVRAGIPPLQAIKMATINGAKILKWDDKLGSIEAGKIADLLVVKGNPADNIEDTRNVQYVIKGGKIVDRKAMKVK